MKDYIVKTTYKCKKTTAGKAKNEPFGSIIEDLGDEPIPIDMARAWLEAQRPNKVIYLLSERFTECGLSS